MQHKESVVYQWFDQVWNQQSEDSIDKLMAQDAIIHGIESPSGEAGAKGFRSFYNTFKQQFNNANIEVEHVICDGDMQVALTHVTAVDRASGKPVQFSGLCMTRIKNGQIAEAWNHYDFLNMYQQLGHQLVPAS